MVIGITGCPGSGKSILAGVIAEQGWILINADDIGREVVENDPLVLGELANAFGQDIIDADDNLQAFGCKTCFCQLRKKSSFK